MVTNFKIFENIKIPQVGDYIIADNDTYVDNFRNDIFKNYIGQITHTYPMYEAEYATPEYIFMMY